MANANSIKIIPENCRGCRRCEVACSWHDPGPLNPRLAGIQIMKLDEGGSDYPVINMECLERFCGKTRSPEQNQAGARMRKRLSLRSPANGLEGWGQ